MNTSFLISTPVVNLPLLTTVQIHLELPSTSSPSDSPSSEKTLKNPIDNVEKSKSSQSCYSAEKKPSTSLQKRTSSSQHELDTCERLRKKGWNYIDSVGKDERGIWDYKRFYFYKTDETKFLLDIPEHKIAGVVDTFLKEHYRFINSVAESIAIEGYTIQDIKRDAWVALYMYIHENRHHFNPFIEYFKSHCFVAIKKYLRAQAAERARELHHGTSNDEQDERDLTERCYGFSQKESYWQNFDIDDLDDTVNDIIAQYPSLAHMRHIIYDVIDDQSLLNFHLKYYFRTTYLTPQTLAVVYGYKMDEAIKKAATLSSALRPSSAHRKNRSTDIKADTFEQAFSAIDQIDKDLIKIGKYVFHKHIYVSEQFSTAKKAPKVVKKILKSFINKKTHIKELNKIKFKKHRIFQCLYEAFIGAFTPLGIVAELQDQGKSIYIAEIDIHLPELQKTIRRFYDHTSCFCL